MEVRIGYVANALAIYNLTPSSSYTFTSFSQVDRESAMQRAIDVGRKNLEATRRILYYNAAHGIRLYRMSSSIVPLATHPEVGINVRETYGDMLEELGRFARMEDIRVTMHPNQFTLLNGAKPVVRAALRNLDYHTDLMDGMGLDAACKVNIHVGGVYGNREAAIQRLYDNMPLVPRRVRDRLTFENDDKTYTALETLLVCEQTGQPMMLDLHHDWCNPSDATPITLIPRIAATWQGQPMKVHVSNKKNDKEFRSHSDYIDDVAPLLAFLRGCKDNGLERVDVMVEAKRKDLACLQLAETLGAIRGIRRVDGAVLEV